MAGNAAHEGKLKSISVLLQSREEGKAGKVKLERHPRPQNGVE